uniref:Uncharacterized protein n=1 Tax=Caenorhabditis japonica TaxID=281687 RepID=A0A8R1IUG4_CAEJA
MSPYAYYPSFLRFSAYSDTVIFPREKLESSCKEISLSASQWCRLRNALVASFQLFLSLAAIESNFSTVGLPKENGISKTPIEGFTPIMCMRRPRSLSH